MHKTFKFRLFISYIILVSFALGLTAFAINEILSKHLVIDLTTSLSKQAKLLSHSLDLRDIKKENIKKTDKLAKDFGELIKSRVTIISASGKVLGDSQEPFESVLKMENHSNRPEIENFHEIDKPKSIIRYSRTLNEEMLYLAEPIKQNNELLGFTRIAIPLNNVKKTFLDIKKAILTVSLICAAFAFVLGLWILKIISKPFSDIIYASKKFAAGDFSYRINILYSSGELKKLSETLNAMAQEIDTKIKELEFKKQELEAIFSSITESIIAINRQGVIYSVNSASEKLLEINENQSKGKTILEVLRNAKMDEIVKRALSQKAPVTEEIELFTQAKKIINITAAPILENGEINGCVIVSQDITEHKNIEAIRKDFVANVSHELKTPLTAIKACLETISMESTKDQGEMDFIKTAEKHALRLENLISDLLNLSAIESGKVRLEKREVRPQKILETVFSSLEKSFLHKNIYFENNLPDSLVIKADEAKLEQIFTNLMDNAVKFTEPNGKVSVKHNEKEDCFIFFVEDNGIGISAEHITRIFERFYTTDKARSKQLGGTGLGLSIVKHLIELHGGTVNIESQPNKGSRFSFTIPK